MNRLFNLNTSRENYGILVFLSVSGENKFETAKNIFSQRVF